MSPDEFKFASSCLDDDRRLIALGKAQRWDVTKWIVGLNIGLATASVAINQRAAAALIFGFAILVAKRRSRRAKPGFTLR